MAYESSTRATSSLCISPRGVHRLVEVDLLPLPLIDPAAESRGCGAFTSVGRHEDAYGGSCEQSACLLRMKRMTLDGPELTCELCVRATGERTRDSAH